MCIVQQLITFRLRGDDDYRLSVLLAQTETLMRWRVLCDSGQVTSQVTRKSAAHQHSFAVLACATFFETFLCCVHIHVCTYSRYIIVVVLFAFFDLFFFYFSLDLPVANLCSAFKRVLLSCCVSVCCWMMPTAVLSLARPASC